MQIKKLLFVLLTASLLITSTNNIYATDSIFAFNPDPVSSAMGDGGVALSSNFINSTFINPASSIGIYRTTASLASTNLTGDILHTYGGIGFVTNIGVFGASITYVDYKLEDFYNNNREKIRMSDTNDIGLSLNYSLPLKRYLPTFIDYGGFGVNLKFLRSSLVGYVTEAVAVDVGAIFAVPTMPDFSIGFAGKNLGVGEKFVKETATLPQMLTLGLAYHTIDFYDLKVILDYTNQKNYQDFTSIGLSINPVYFLSLRGGLKLGGDSIFSSARFGVGIQFESIAFDYAFLPTSDLNATHQFSLNLSFGSFADQKTAYEYYLTNHFRKAQASYYAKDFVSARQQFDDILSVYPDHKPSQEYLKKTIEQLSKIDDYNFEKINSYMEKADKALAKNDVVKADHYYRKVLDLDPTNKVAKTGIEKAEQSTHNVKVLQARQENKDRIDYLWSRYEKFYKKGDLVKARNSLKYLLDIDSENALANEKIVDLDNQLAKIAADKTAEIYKEGMKYYKAGKYEEAITYFEAVVVAAPHRLDVQHLIQKAQSNIQQMEEEKRLSALEQEQNKVSGSLTKKFDTALRYYEKGNLEKSLTYFEQAKDIAYKYEFTQYYNNANNYISKINNTLSEKYYKKGFELFRKNKFEGAAKNYKLALKYNPANTSASFEYERVADQVAQTYYDKGMTAYSKNEMQTARECLRKALYYNPNKTEAKKALERIR